MWGAEKPFVVEPNQSTELIKFKVPEGDAVVICARLRDVETKEILSRSSAWPEPCVFLFPLPPFSEKPTKSLFCHVV